ncbi:MAG TPA: hypothetical protein VNC78_03130 [Actinomycetota bacterium]|nr:hypothetical protein [Actinomycetota bacterium]
MRAAVIASVVVTALHYTDNYISIEDYPQPDWIHRETILIAWSLLTLIGIGGYMMFRDGRSLSAGLYLLVYSYTGLSSLGHYPYGSAGEFSAKMHVFIWTDALVGALVAICAVWILLSRRSGVEPEIVSTT